MKLKRLLDGYGLKIKAVWGREGYYKDLHPDGLYDVILETNKGFFRIDGCSNCEMVSFSKQSDEWFSKIKEASEL